MPAKTKSFSKSFRIPSKQFRHFVRFVEKLFNKYKLEAQKTDDNQSCQKLNEKASGEFIYYFIKNLLEII